MIDIRRILCPVDFSQFSAHALDHAAAIACWYEARLTVLHVVPNRPVMDLPSPPLAPEARARVARELDRFAAHLPAEMARETCVGEAADVHRAILTRAADMPADLLVMGSHGRSGFTRVLLGSVTERVVRQAPCPTLVVPPRAPDTAPDAPVRFRRILCPVDFSDASRDAFAWALNLAEEADAELTLLHVIELPPELRANPLTPGFDVAALHASAQADALRRLRGLVPEQARTYCTVKAATREGAAYHGILCEAAVAAAELIVMGERGGGAFDRFVFGSNTARVMRTATCPVLIVPPRAEASR
jgi:nucleotide-binding universal stress UspA family protein